MIWPFFQEYVQPPVPIQLTPQTKYNQPVTRSKVLDQPLHPSSRLQVGRFYAVLSDSDEEGFKIVQCKSVYPDSFTACLLAMGRFKNS